MAKTYTKFLYNISKGRKFNNIFHSKTLQKYTEFGIFGLKIYHLATLSRTVIHRWNTCRYRDSSNSFNGYYLNEATLDASLGNLQHFMNFYI
jgi:hypothetical protein